MASELEGGKERKLMLSEAMYLSIHVCQKLDWGGGCFLEDLDKLTARLPGCWEALPQIDHLSFSFDPSLRA